MTNNSSFTKCNLGENQYLTSALISFELKDLYGESFPLPSRYGICTYYSK